MAEESPEAPLSRVAVLIPCYNAGGRLDAVARGAALHAAWVFVVDDGSTDGCADAVAGDGLVCLRHDCNRGKGHALLTGFRAILESTSAECIAALDADGQHDPEALPGLVAAFDAADADLLIGSRQLDQRSVPWASRLGNGVTAAVTRRLLPGCPVDTQSGYRLHRRSFLEQVLPWLHGGRYETEMELLVMALRGGYRVCESPIATRYEPGNASSHFRKVRDSWLIYRRLGQALLGKAGTGIERG